MADMGCQQSVDGLRGSIRSQMAAAQSRWLEAEAALKIAKPKEMDYLDGVKGKWTSLHPKQR